MKSLAVMLLAYLLGVHLIAKFSPIPFIGLAVGLLGFPLALKISWRSLFMIEVTALFFSWAINIDSLMGSYSLGQTILINAGMDNLVNLYAILFLILLPITAVAASAISATLMKAFSRFTPKRIRFVVMGNP